MKKKITALIILIVLLALAGCVSAPIEPIPAEPGQESETASCEILVFADGETKSVALNNVNHQVQAHIESEDSWASFSVDGDFGEEGQYYSSAWGNPLMLPGNEHGVSSKIVINEVPIAILEVGYDNNNQEYAKVCIG